MTSSVERLNSGSHRRLGQVLEPGVQVGRADEINSTECDLPYLELEQCTAVFVMAQQNETEM